VITSNLTNVAAYIFLQIFDLSLDIIKYMHDLAANKTMSRKDVSVK
jgi:hypothetical protein